jgi:hypothetical protein
VIAGCQASTTRPGFLPHPDASVAEVHLTVPEATRLLAEVLRADSVPIARVEERDGFVESEWFAFPGFQAVRGRQLGPATDKIRAWVDPGRPGPPPTSIITVEVIYRLYVDPARDPREAERHVGESHTVRQRVLAVLEKLKQGGQDR